MTKVVKFGGTSLAEAKQFLKVADIIRSDPDRRYVVPSAPGKRFSGDTKVTDMFYACYDSASRGGNFEEIFQKIKMPRMSYSSTRAANTTQSARYPFCASA